jgi:hypothetical protein
MENHVLVRMDSKAGVCYMNFGMGTYALTRPALREEHRLAI